MSAWLGDVISHDSFRMLVHRPVHGMQGFVEKQGLRLYLTPHVPEVAFFQAALGIGKRS